MIVPTFESPPAIVHSERSLHTTKNTSLILKLNLRKPHSGFVLSVQRFYLVASLNPAQHFPLHNCLTMPRNTRAAKRAEEFEIAQDQEQIASTPQDTQAETTAATENAPSSNRAALKEVTANVIQEFVEQQNIDVKDQQDAEHNKGKNKGSTKGKGGKSGGSKGKKNQNKQHGNDREDNPNNTQPAPELQRQDTATSSESSGAAAAEQLKYATISGMCLESHAQQSMLL